MELKDRFILLRNYLKMNQVEFSKKIGSVKQTISRIENGEGNPSYDIIVGVKNACPEVNLEWLLLGIGDIWSSFDKTASVQISNNSGHENTIIQNHQNPAHFTPSLSNNNNSECLKEKNEQIAFLNGQVALLKELLEKEKKTK